MKDLSNKPSDLSEKVWLFLLFLIILICEQLLSVALSHHSASNELESTAPSAAAALRKGNEAVLEPEEVL